MRGMMDMCKRAQRHCTATQLVERTFLRRPCLDRDRQDRRIRMDPGRPSDVEHLHPHLLEPLALPGPIAPAPGFCPAHLAPSTPHSAHQDRHNNGRAPLPHSIPDQTKKKRKSGATSLIRSPDLLEEPPGSGTGSSSSLTDSASDPPSSHRQKCRSERRRQRYF
jgi:hypothetical protein